MPRTDAADRASRAEPESAPLPLRVALGMAALVAAVYFLTGPGRIDTIDGQYRWEAARNLLAEGRPRILDPYLGGDLVVVARDGSRWSSYGLARVLSGIPLAGLGEALGGAGVESGRFWFAATSAAFGGLLAGLLLVFMARLGATPRGAAGWTAVAAFSTLLWPVAASTFDQAQHAFLGLAAVWLAWRSGERDSPGLAAAAGLACGALVQYQESYVPVVPFLALPVLAGALSRPSFLRAAIRGLAWALPVVASLGIFFWYRDLRAGPAVGVAGGGAGAVLGAVPDLGGRIGWNLAVGIPTLLASPGKSILIYSPPVVLALAGLPGLWRRAPWVAAAAISASLAHLLTICLVPFPGGDWCWGPRYLALTVPLLALALPFAPLQAGGRAVAGALVAGGALVQVLGLSLDFHRFYVERGVPDAFWEREPLFHFQESVLVARVGELAALAREGVPPTATRFAANPYGSPTYAPLVLPARRRLAGEGPAWVRRFGVFFLPKPWPLWMAALPPEQRPIRPGPPMALGLGAGLAGAALLRSGLGSRRGGRSPRGSPEPGPDP
ncbi:hypothetical protein L6R50_11650 [Myxococcota bacterium]|nr:hypothetical protein [Myxococcota bacterium]